MPRLLPWSIALCLLAGATGSLRAADTAKPVVVVTTSLLATAVADLAGDAVEVVALLPPGSCPSYFDLEPAQVRRVAGAALFLRHDFQPFVDAKLAAIGVGSERRAVPRLDGANCIPSNYARLCAAVAVALGRCMPAEAAAFANRADAIAQRSAQLEASLQARAAPLRGRPLLVAHWQVEFVRWLGLEVAAEFPAAGDPPAASIAAAAAAGRAARVFAVVGNSPNGRRTPETLASTLQVPVVVFENFPPVPGPGAYWAMVEANLTALLACAPQP